MPTESQLVSGLGGAIGSALTASGDQLIFVEYAGKLSALDLFPSSTIISSGIAVLMGTWDFDFDTGVESGPGPNVDVFWEQVSAVVRQMTPQNSATIVNLGSVNFGALTADNLVSLPYSNTPIDGNNDATNQLVVGDVFAVHTTAGNYAKVQVLSYGYNLTIQWVTYQMDSGYAVLGTGYNQPEDVTLSDDGIHAYVTERTGDLVKVALTSANRSSATVICSGMNTPQQMFLDEAHATAYVVEYASPANLWKVDLTTGTKTSIISTLDQAIGIVLSSDLQYAYISEQTTGPEGGRISVVQISTASRTTLVQNLTNPFFLTWADEAEDTLYVPLRDPSNTIIAVNISSATSNTVATGVLFRPSSVTLPSPGEMLICCDQVIEEVSFNSFSNEGPLLMAIGFIPENDITAAGLANTSVDPTYFYQVTNTPFGGSLPIMVNHQRADNDGDYFYQVLVDGIVHTDSWTDYYWNGTEYVLKTISPQTVGTATGCYPVRPLSELFLWLNPTLGDLLDSTGLTDGLHTIWLQFLDAGGNPVETSNSLTIMVNNDFSVAVLNPPLLGGTPATPCGILSYGTNTSQNVIINMTASQPDGYATFSLEEVRGVTPVTLPPPTSGPVSSAPSSVTMTVAALLGTCLGAGVAGFAVYLYVYSTINNGWSRQSQYDASALLAYVLAP
jgi:hypothetical protein